MLAALIKSTMWLLRITFVDLDLTTVRIKANLCWELLLDAVIHPEGRVAEVQLT